MQGHSPWDGKERGESGSRHTWIESVPLFLHLSVLECPLWLTAGGGLCMGKVKQDMVSCFKDLNLFNKYLLNESLVAARG